MRRLLVCFVFLGCLVGQGSRSEAIVIRHDRADQRYLDYGAASAFDSVGRFDVASGRERSSASGTLIDSRWVLTAAHVVDGATSLDFHLDGRSYSADAYASFPTWRGNLSAGNDIALVRLADPVSGITPALRYNGRSEQGQRAFFVGFGMTGTGLTGATTFDARKRAGDNIIEGLTGRNAGASLFYADFDNPNNRRDNVFGSPTPLGLEAMIAPGDSGGAVFLRTSRGFELAGVHSFGASFTGWPDSSYGNFSGHTRVSSFNSWIDSILLEYTPVSAGAAAPTTGGRAMSLTLIPEPSSLWLLAAGFLLARRGRHG